MRQPAIVRRTLVAFALAALTAFTATPSSAVGPGTLAYVHDAAGSSRVFGYALAGGTLTPLPGSPYTAPDTSGSSSAASHAIAYDATRNVVVSAGGTGLTVWTIAGDGSLSAVAGSPFTYTVHQPGTSVQTVTSGSRSFAYVTQYYGSSMDGFEIGANGTLTHLGGFPITGLPGASTLSSGGTRLVYANEDKVSVNSYSVQPDGSVKKGSSKAVGKKGSGYVYSVTVDPLGQFAYAGQYSSGGQIYGYKVSPKNGKLAAVKGKVVPGIIDVDGGISVSTNHLVAAFSGNGGTDAQMFAQSSKGKLTKLGAAQSSGLGKVSSSAFSADGAFLVAASTQDGLVRSYAVDAGTGQLTAGDTSAFSPANVNGLIVVTR